MRRHRTLHRHADSAATTPTAPLHSRMSMAATRRAAPSWLRALLALGLWLGLSTCSEGAPDSRAARVARETETTPATQPADAVLTRLSIAHSGPERDTQLGELAKAFAASYEATGQRFAGSLTKGRSDDHLLLLRYGRCYRILGVGGTHIEDLDIALYDRDQVERLRDLSADRYPRLGLSPSLCPARTEAYRMQVSAFSGEGDYSIAVFQSPL